MIARGPRPETTSSAAKMGTEPLVLLVFFLALLLFGCGATKNTAAPGSGDSGGGDGGGDRQRVAVSGGSFTRVSPGELKGMTREEDLLLVNTHVPFEGNIPGTDLSVPYDEIGGSLERLPRRGKKVVLYCRSGRMSALAARTLVRAGYENVWDLRGGMIAWKEAGFRLKGTRGASLSPSLSERA